MCNAREIVKHKDRYFSFKVLQIFHMNTKPSTWYIENNTWQKPYHMSYHPETPISAQGSLGSRDDIGRGWYGISKKK